MNITLKDIVLALISMIALIIISFQPVGNSLAFAETPSDQPTIESTIEPTVESKQIRFIGTLNSSEFKIKIKPEQEATTTITHTSTPTPTIWQPTPAARIVPVPTDTLKTDELVDHLWFGRPFTDYGSWGSFTYPYGTNSKGNYLWHFGIDVQGSFGNIIRAVGDGVIVHAGPDDPANMLGPRPDFYGQAVVIQHDQLWDDQPVYTLYGHVSEVLVDVGQSVKVGEPIARVGDSGVATGAHLHLEVRFGGNTYNHTRNPDLWISPDIWYGVIIGRVMDAQGYFVPAQLVTLHDAQDSRRYRRETYSYPNDVVNSDDMYLENFSFADVPTGDYILNATFDGHTLTVPVSVREQQASFVVIQSPITSTVSASTAR